MATQQMRRKTKGIPEPVDKHVGQRLRVRRSLVGMSQEKLAEAIGITFQQIQKYERGTNRISAGRLFQFSRILGVPVAYFYEHFGEDSLKSDLVKGLSDNAQEEFEGEDVLHRKETLDLVRAFYNITDPHVRKSVYNFVRSLGTKSPSDEQE